MSTSFVRLGVLLAWVIGVGLGSVGLSGCRTLSSGGLPAVEVVLLDNGQAQLGDATFPQAELARALKAAGAGRETEISVVVPPRLPESEMSRIFGDLHKAGFRKMVFKRHLKPAATIQRQGNPR